MIDDEQIAARLEAASDRRVAKLIGRDVRPVKGIRGVPQPDIAKVIDAAWRGGVDLDEDAGALDRLFGAAWEDGLVAIGLAAAALPDAPDAAWDLAVGWAGRVDDTGTADALGWLLLGPALLASGGAVATLTALGPRDAHPMTRRAVVAAGLAWLPDPVEGPCAAGLRARLDVRHVRFVEDAVSNGLGPLLAAFIRDEAPPVQKAVRRVLRGWSDADPAAVVAWAEGWKGGFPRMLGDEIDRAKRRAARA